MSFAVERLSPSERDRAIRQMRKTNHQLLEALERMDPDRACRLNMSFHEGLYAAADSRVILTMTQSSWNFFPVAFAVFYQMSARFEELRRKVYEEHEAILDAMETGDASAAVLAAQRHVRLSGERVFPNGTAQLYPSPGLL